MVQIQLENIRDPLDSVAGRLHSLMNSNAKVQTDSKSSFADGAFSKDSTFLEFADLITSETVAKQNEAGRSLVHKINDVSCYVSQMDACFSGLARLHPSRCNADVSNLVKDAHAVFNRMPQVPRQVEEVNVLHEFRHLETEAAARSREYIRVANDKLSDIKLPDQHGFPSPADWYSVKSAEIDQQKQQFVWQSFVEHWPVDTNTLRILLWVASSPAGSDLPVALQLNKYVYFLAGVFDSIQFYDEEGNRHPKEASLELRRQFKMLWRIYVSICWQRATMLLQYYALGAILAQGWSSTWANLLSVRSIFAYTTGLMFMQPKYMCGQAVTLLRQSKATTVFDFRKMFERFETAFSNFPARCDPRYAEYRCDFIIPQSCTRFQGQAEIPDQSQHDSMCDKKACRLISWQESSYDAVNGHSRAVDIYAMEISANSRLIYRVADKTTLAISHVWSHGQGGRPETGFNTCLHNRYSSIAKKYNCSSYWIDTCCIPTDETRRMEAIRGINGVFSTSRITLVCDRDIMCIDTKSEHFMETVLATLLVADWNVRAWTLLEGFRGRSNLHLLCTNGELVSFTKMCSTLYTSGAIDMVIFLSALQHLLPSVSFQYEESGSLLRKRAASRRGDELIIWGLLCQDRVTKTGESLVQGIQSVRTGFLVSRIPRIDMESLHWAPAFPSQGNHPDEFTISDGEGSEVGVRCPSGLVAVWLVHHIDRDLLFRPDDAHEFYGSGSISLLSALTGQYSFESIPLARDKYDYLAILHPQIEGQNDPYAGRDAMQFQRLVVLCASHDRKTWRWITVVPYNFDIVRVGLKTLSWSHFKSERITLD
ncbi:MAG: hypothetical protein M1822_002817 [Bathelium mastoideum]|nr:MAG: hypothetical protein M1822_002817 [Bathelium mastoideum]